MTNHKPDEEAIFKVAREIKSPDVQDAYLEQVCADNQKLRARVVSLLLVEEEQPGFLESPVSVIVTIEDPITEQAGAQIGPYKLLEQIGEGGMGVVYMADQLAPVRRRVALKIIKPGMDTRQVIARFEAERQALALMDHPNIARVLDAGATEAGRPYFVMELVRGVPITDYCDQDNLSVPDRLALFVQVCQAVQHAHQKGIIHRDLKPSNVLVTLHDGRPVPKVIDFGVAKATNQQLTEKTLFTNFSQMIGTPLYMSPEQAEMSSLDVDTRSDIYSLGVLLYELLTGTTPFARQRIHEMGPDEVRRIIREEEPPRPSTAVDTLGQTRTREAGRRKIDPGRFAQLLRGDLDWIVMKALEKDRSRRYVSADDLARDIERFLHDQPVEAHSPSTIYRLRKLVLRNRVALTTAVLVSTALVFGTIVSIWQAVRASRAERVAEAAQVEETRHRRIAEDQRNEAEKQRARAEENFRQARKAVDDYLTAVGQSKLFNVPGSQSLRKELLESALAYYQRFIDQHDDDTTVQAELAAAYLRVGDITSALGSKTQALEAIRKGVDKYERLARDNPTVMAYQAGLARSWNDRGVVERALGRLSDTEFSCSRALVIYEQLVRDHAGIDEYWDGAAKAHTNLGIARRESGKTADAEASYRQAIDFYQQLVRRSPEIRTNRAGLANALYHLGHLQRAAHRTTEAEASFRQTGEVYEALVAEDGSVATYQLGVAHAQYNIGIMNRALGRPAEATTAHQRARDAYDQLAHQNPTVASYRVGVARACFNLGLLQAESGQIAEAQQNWAAAADAFSAAAELGYPRVEVFTGLTGALEMLGRWEKAASAYANVVAASDHAWEPLVRLALLYAAAGDDTQYRATCAELVSRYGEQANALEALSIAPACAIGEHAVDDMPKVIDIAQRALASDSGNPVCRAAFGAVLFRAGRTQDAIAALKEALPLLEAAEQSATWQQLDRIRASRLFAETILALAYRQQEDQPSLATQIRKLRPLIEHLEATAPQYSEAGDAWLLPLWIHVAQRELAQLESQASEPATTRRGFE